MMSRAFPVVALAFALLLAGCSRVVDVAGLGALQQGGGSTISISADGAQPAIMRATLESRGRRETLRRVSRRGDYEIWRGGRGGTITLRQGVVVATSAQTPDLISVESALPSDWNRAPRPAVSERIHRYVDGNEQVFIRGYLCELSAPVQQPVTVNERNIRTSRTDETCSNATQSFRNSYWLDGSGRMVQSRQWLGPDAGYLRLDHHLP